MKSNYFDTVRDLTENRFDSPSFRGLSALFQIILTVKLLFSFLIDATKQTGTNPVKFLICRHVITTCIQSIFSEIWNCNSSNTV